ncbi:hypothetical protein HXX76_006741 [Chlamydomonas incerta]|uniref:Uncharacterized protein n=1 Tax=Chlamydomonas incerta TaxID=51695 RepID=A0A835W3Z8_CHLIN|nr:hypothetical protein HXX76_006741 [Chlamydomonas incerta]|eukprot:KAG2436438.1 hypothetical protein HXX76_006741 [Chlamydomonas incerta]
MELGLSDLEERLRMADSADVGAMQGAMLRVAAGHAPRSDRAAHLFAELLRNIRGMGWALPCVEREPPDGGPATTNSSACGGGCYFAVTLEDGTSFSSLPNLVSQLLAVLGRLGGGEHARRSFVSVYASGVQDPSTQELLGLLRRVLDLLGVPNRVVTRGSIRRPAPGSERTAAAAQDQHRLLLRTTDAKIAGGAGLGLRGDGGSGGGSAWADAELASEDGYRAALRNAVLEPLVAISEPRRCDDSSGGGSGSAGGAAHAEGLPCPQLSHTSPPPPARVSTLVFLAGGAFLCAADVLRLLRHSSADVACGLDLAKAALPLLTPDERRAAMAAHAAAAWGLPRSWAAALSRSGFAYGAWARMYGRTDMYLPWSHLVLRGSSSVQWSRDASGRRLRPLPPYAADDWTAARLGLGLPTPVYGCWGGLVVAGAQPFLGRQARAARAATPTAESASASRRAVLVAGVGAEAGSGAGKAGAVRRTAGVRRRLEPLPLRFRAPQSGSAGAGAASRRAEGQGLSQGQGGCVNTAPELALCTDMHERGRHRWLVDPNVRLTYDWPALLELYGSFEMAGPENVRGLTFQAEELGVGDIHVSEEREEDELGGDYGSSTSSDSSTAGGGADARLGGLTTGVREAAADYGSASGLLTTAAAQERRAAVRAERRWQQEWLPRVAAGAAAVECCGAAGQELDAGAAGAAVDSGSSCVRQDWSAAWEDWDAASGGGNGGGAADAVAARSKKWRGSDLVGRSGSSERQVFTEAIGGGTAGAVSASDAAADAALTALEN